MSEHIDFLCDQMEAGTIAPEIDRDAITSLYLTEVGKATFYPPLPTATN